MKKVIVASKNFAKINSTQQGFEKMFPEETFEFVGVSVPSGVADQPFSDRETYQGAYNRAKNAQNEVPDADYWVGLEGGVERVGEEMQVFAWIVVVSKERIGKGKTGTLFIPQAVVQLINEGKELSEADDIVFQRKNSGHESGVVGVLTGNIVNRVEYYVGGVILALIPFKNTDLY